MLSTVSSHHTPCPSFRRSQPIKGGAQCNISPENRNAFHLLASLQLAVRTFKPDVAVENDLLSGSNSINLRKQGQLALTFALANHTAVSNAERISLANKLEDAVDKAFYKEDYRARIYVLGGVLAADADCGEGVSSLVKGLLCGRINIDRATIGDL